MNYEWTEVDTLLGTSNLAWVDACGAGQNLQNYTEFFLDGVFRLCGISW